MQVNHYRNRAEWLAARRETLGSSDAPVIMGVGFAADSHARKSLYELWAEKTGKLDAAPAEDSARLRAGNYMEEGTAKELQLALPDKRVVRPTDLRICVNGFRGCTLDMAVFEDCTHVVPPAPQEGPFCLGDLVVEQTTMLGPAEGKTVDAIAASDWSDEEPSAYALIQLHHQMNVGSWEQGWIAAWIGFSKFRWYHVPYNEALGNEILEAEEAFWQNVQRDIPPEVDGSESCRKVLRLLHPKDNGETVAFDARVWNYDEHAYLKVRAKEIKDKIDLMENQLKELIGPRTFADFIGPGGEVVARYSWKHSSKAGYSVPASETRTLLPRKI